MEWISNHYAVRVSGDKVYGWDVPRLWALADAMHLPVFEVEISSLPAFDADCWFSGRAPTVREVAEHARRIMEADLSHPVLLRADGSYFDGLHRTAKAHLQGNTVVRARRFPADPPADWCRPADAPPRRKPRPFDVIEGQRIALLRERSRAALNRERAGTAPIKVGATWLDVDFLLLMLDKALKSHTSTGDPR